MAHDIFNNTAYAGRKAGWHGLGQVLPDATTVRELASAAGITWEYTTASIFYEVEDLTGETWHHQVPNTKIILRNGLAPMGIVSNDYEYIQPSEIIESLDHVVVETGWTPETAMALGKGETTAFCIYLGDWFMPGQDQVNDFLTITDTVDGKHALTAFISPIRTVCRNTLNLGMRKSSVSVNLTHKTGHAINYRDMITVIVKQQNTVREALKNLSFIKFTDDKLTEVYNTIFTEKTDDSTQGQAIARRMDSLKASAFGFARRMVEEQNLPLDGWAAFNGASEAIEHSKLMPNLSTRTAFTLGRGKAVDMVEKAYVTILKAK